MSTLWWEEESLSILNIVGMAVCVAGIVLHVGINAYYSKGEGGHFVEPTNPVTTLTPPTAEEKKSESKVHEDMMELLPSTRNGINFVIEDSDDSDVIYTKSL